MKTKIRIYGKHEKEEEYHYLADFANEKHAKMFINNFNNDSYDLVLKLRSIDESIIEKV